MRHIKDICSLVKEVRQRIVETMQERGISEVEFIPSEDEWLEQNPDKSVDEYYAHRDEVCPNVVYFDKYGCGYEYQVTKVLLVGKDSLGFPLFKLECEANELGYDTFLDTDVYDMTWVYEMLEKHLGLEDEPEKVWVLFDESLYDYELQGRRIMVFKSEDEARKKFKEFVGESRKTAEDNGWEIGSDSDDFFEAYPDGSWGTSHETVELSKTAFSESVWCHN